MSIQELILEMQQARIDIVLSGDELEVSYPVGQVLSGELIGKLTRHKGELLQWLRSGNHEPAGTSIPRAAIGRTYPLPAAQKRIWMIQQLKTAQSAYNMYASCVIKGEIEWDVFEMTWKQLVVRHEILRTFFIEADGEVRQQVEDTVTNQPIGSLIDCRRIPDKQNYISELIASLLSTRFKLNKCGLYQYRLIQTGDREYIFVLVLHHIIADGLSMSILSRELMSLYQAACRRERAVLPELPIQYKDYSVWITQQPPDRAAADLGYWEERFAGPLPLLNLPLDFTRPSFRSFKGAVAEFLVDSKTIAAFRQLTQENKITVASAVLAFFKIVLFKWSGQQDITVGMASSGRDHIDLEHLVGLFVSTLPVRTRLDPDMRVLDYLQRVHRQVLEAIDHQLLPFENIVDHLAIERDPARNPLFDVFYNFTDRSEFPESTDGEWKILPYPIQRDTSRFDLLLDAVLRDRQLLLRIEFDTALFIPSTIDELGKYFKDIIASCITDASQLLAGLPVHPADISHAGSFQLPLLSFSAPQLSMAAVLQNDSTLSYELLFREAVTLGDRLIHSGVLPGTPMSSCCDSEGEKLISLMALIRAKATYVPLPAEWREGEWFFENGIMHLVAGEGQEQKTALLPDGITVHRFSYRQQTRTSASTGNMHMRRLTDAGVSFEKPADELQLLLVSVWQEVLHVERVGIRDNFFTVGGDSMKVIRMVNEFNSLSGLQL
jgi:hypothetical protein